MSSLEKSSKQAVPVLRELMEVSQYNNRLVVKHYGNLTMRMALTSKSRSIGLIAKESEEKATRCIQNLFEATSLYFGDRLSKDHTEVIANELLSKYEYRNLKLEDLVVISMRLKEAEIYKLTPARILREIKKYWDERVKVAMEMNKQPSNFDQALEQRMLKHYKSNISEDQIEKIASKRSYLKHKYK